jgi:GT2 family glycosyltransferase
MSVSVIIVNYNAGALLAKCVKRLVQQSVRPEKILVVDNASTDDSISLLDERDSIVVVRELDKNIGFAAGNNLALKECSTEFVALVNPDAFADQGWLENMLKVAHACPHITAFGSRLLTASNSAILDGVGDAYHMSGLVWREANGRKQREGDLVARTIFSPCAAAALYRRAALVESGGFDEDFFCYVEDVDLGFRLRLLGHEALYVPDAVVSHVGSATTGGGRGDFALYHGHRNMVWTYVKNMPGVLFWCLLPCHIALNLATIIWFTALGRGGVIFRAKRDALKMLPQMWQKRKRIQEQRVVAARAVWKTLDKRLIPVRRNGDRKL